MSERPVKIVLLEDVPKYARLMRDMLQSFSPGEFEVEWVGAVAEGVESLNRPDIDLVLVDLAVSDGAGFDHFIKARKRAPHLPIIVLSTLDDENLALRAVQEGAQDYLVKGEVTNHLLVRSIRYAIERKKSESALLSAEEKYRGIFEHIVEGIFQTSPQGQYISANPALARIYGYASAEELIGTMTNIARDLYVDPNRRPEFVRQMEGNDVVTNFESRVYRKDGSVIWISENVRAVRDSQHKLLYYEGTVEDITARKTGEENLRNSETLYHSLVETLPQNIFRKNLSEQFTFANQRFCQVLGKPLEEILGKTDFDFFPPDLAAKYQKDDQVIMQTGKTLETVEENQPPGGEKIYVTVVKTPLYDAKGEIIGLQGIFWDITERKRAEERIRKASVELARSREELREKNEQMEDDLRMAREIQQALLPQQYPCFPKSASAENSSLLFSHRYLPAGVVGGDFFNIRALSDTKAGVFICDVMGHGVRSALVTAILRALVEELTPLAADPGQLLRQINHDLRTILKQTGTPMFTTAFYLVADLEQKQISYANAGHPPPLILRRKTAEVEFMRNAGRKSCCALGLFDDTTYTVSTCPLAEQDLVVLFTDGVFDVEGENDLLNTDWLAEQVRTRSQQPAAQIFDQVLEQLQKFSHEGHFADDVCLVGMELRTS